MVAEALGVRPDRLGEQPQVVAQAFGHHIDMMPRLFGLLPNFLSQSAKLEVNLSKSQIDAREPLGESLIDPLESRVHGPFELGNRHRFPRCAHHSIVMYATTMPRRSALRLPCSVYPGALAGFDVAISSTHLPPDVSNR